MNSYFHLILLVFLTIFFVHYLFYKSSTISTESYALANRNVGIFALTATLVMTEFNMATLISFSSFGYLSGLKALMLPSVFLVGLIFYALTVAKKWKNYNGVTVVDFFNSRFNKKIGAISAVFLLLAMSGFSAAYLKALTLLFASALPKESYWLISAYLVFFTLIMVIKKGLVAIIKIDSVAFILVLMSMILTLYKVANGTLDEAHANIIPFHADILNNDFVLSLIPLTMFSYILAPWYGQRIFAAKDARVAYISVILSAIFVFILYGVGVLISYYIASQGVELTDPQLSFPYAVEQYLAKFSYPLGYLLLFLISSTTLTGVWNAMANITVEFSFFKRIKNNNIIATLICAFVTYMLSNLVVDNILNKMILANIPVISLSFALLAGFYWKKTSIVGVYASIVIGMIVGISAYLIFGEQGNYTWYWAFIGIPLIFISGIVGSLLFPQHANSFETLNYPNFNSNRTN